MANTEVSLSQVIGHNAKRLRENHTLEEVAFQAQRIGAKWSSGSVSTIELGRSKCTIGTVAILAIAIAAAKGEKNAVPISELLSTDHLGGKASQAIDGIDLTVPEIGHWLNGGELQVLANLRNIEKMGEARNKLMEQLFPPTPTEVRLAQKLSIEPLLLREISNTLWGQGIEERRDEIAGADATPQKKGRVSRELLDEVSAHLEANHGDD